MALICYTNYDALAYLCKYSRYHYLTSLIKVIHCILAIIEANRKTKNSRPVSKQRFFQQFTIFLHLS